MNSNSPRMSYLVFALAFLFCSMAAGSASAIEGIHYDGSSQIYWAIVKDSSELFTKETGIKVTAEDRKTQDAIPSLVSGRCNVGGLARKMKLSEKAQNQDLFETLIAKDHMAVFVSKDSKIDSLTLDQVKKAFSGEIADWKDLGDEPGPVQVVIPQTKTASNNNFASMAMGEANFSKDSVITDTAGGVLDAARGKRAISFISYGAVAGKPDFKVIKIDGKSAGSEGYPLAQDMYFATIGKPSGDVAKYIDFFLTGSGKEAIQKAGLLSAK
ncbi:MAG: substrate-binding domain-containing protein [Desulfobacteraceae bacterium]|nr:substrate-binding domain-containing protein [Desulfobacteraceae bacterium]